MTHIQKRLVRARIELNLTQAEMAAAVHVSLSTWRNYERGTSKPDADVLMKLAALGFDGNWLLLGVGAPMRQDRYGRHEGATPGGLADEPEAFASAHENLALYRELLVDIEEVLLEEGITLEPHDKRALVDEVFAEELALRQQGKRLGTAKILRFVRQKKPCPPVAR